MLLPKTPKAYAAHTEFVAPARARSEPWRLVVGLFLGTVVMFLLQLGIWNTVPSLLARGGDGATAAQITLMMLLSFLAMTCGAFAAVQVLHDRHPQSLFGPWEAMKDGFWQVLGALVVLNLVLIILPPYSYGDEPLSQNLDFGTWLGWLPLSLLAVLVQSSAEEIVFRGYIQQQLAARFSSPWVWMILPSAVFGALHYVPAETGENALYIALWAGLFGVLMADLTARAGHLGPAIAVHFVNNALAFLFISLPGDFAGLALFTVPFSASDAEAMRALLPIDFATMLVTWLAARLVLRR